MKYKSTKEEEFADIYQTYSDDIYRVCFHFMKDEKAAKEIMVEAFIEFYDCFEETHPDDWYTCLIHIIKNLIYTYRGAVGSI